MEVDELKALVFQEFLDLHPEWSVAADDREGHEGAADLEEACEGDGPGEAYLEPATLLAPDSPASAELEP